MKRIAIVGASFAGAEVANKLARRLRWELARGDVEIRVFDKDNDFLVQAMYPLIVFNSLSEEHARWRKSELLDPRIKFYHGPKGELVSIDLRNRELGFADGSKYNYDYLVIATGAEFAPQEVPGLMKDYHTFFTLDGALELREILSRFSRGTIVELFVDLPIKCPIVPLKFGLLLDSYLKDRNVRGNVNIKLLYPIDYLHAQPEVNRLGKIMCEQRNIEYIFRFMVSEVNAEEKVVISDSGEKIKYDLLITIPPHRGAKVFRDSGLGDPLGFLPGDKSTLRYRKGKELYEEVYIIGDATALPVTKAASVAHYQADVIAENLVSDILGTGPRKIYRGEDICPMLTDLYTHEGRGRAWLPWWNYTVNEMPFITTRFGWWFLRAFYMTLPAVVRGGL